LARRRCFLQAL